MPPSPQGKAQTVYTDNFGGGAELDLIQIIGGPNIYGTLPSAGGVLNGWAIGGQTYGSKTTKDQITAAPSPNNTQAGGTQLPEASQVRITTVANSGDAVVLPPAQAGFQIAVVNDGANPCNVFPALGDSINSGAPNAAFSLSPGTPTIFYCFSKVPGAGAQWRTK